MTIEEAKAKHEEQLMQLPNVVGVGIGEKGGKKVIEVYVTHKVPESDLLSKHIIPQTLDGYDTDVTEAGSLTA